MEKSALLGAPFYSLAKYSGMGGGPGALRAGGILRALGGPVDAGDARVDELIHDTSEPAKNFRHFLASTESIRKKVHGIVAESLVVLGGECSVVVGSLAGAIPGFKGKPGMVWMDAHGDFNTPETSPSGYVGGMCLAMACGRGPKLTPEVEALKPLLEEERLIHVGSRDLDPPEARAFESSPAKLYTAHQVRRMGGEDAAKEGARHLADSADWIFCHIDVDVIDPLEVPAVNYPTPGGLSTGDVAKMIRAMRMTGKMRVLELTSYNSAKDRGANTCKRIVEMLGAAFS